MSQPPGQNEDQRPMMIQVGNQTDFEEISNRIRYAFIKEKLDKVVLSATGRAITQLIMIAEIVKHRVKNVKQLNELTSQVYQHFDTKNKQFEQKLTCLKIYLSTGFLNKEHYGYQNPLPQDQVNESYRIRPPQPDSDSQNQDDEKQINNRSRLYNNQGPGHGQERKNTNRVDKTSYRAPNENMKRRGGGNLGSGSSNRKDHDQNQQYQSDRVKHDDQEESKRKSVSFNVSLDDNFQKLDEFMQQRSAKVQTPPPQKQEQNFKSNQEFDNQRKQQSQPSGNKSILQNNKYRESGGANNNRGGHRDDFGVKGYKTNYHHNPARLDRISNKSRLYSEAEDHIQRDSDYNQEKPRGILQTRGNKFYQKQNE